MGLGRAQGVFESGDSLGAGKLAWTDTEDAAETAQKGEAADAGGPGQVGEASAFGGVLCEVLAGGGDDVGLWIGAGGCMVRPASFAGAKPGLLRGGSSGEEPDIFASGTAAGAAWTAVDAGGLDGIEELAVGGGVAREDLLPLATGKERWHRGRGIFGWIDVAAGL